MLSNCKGGIFYWNYWQDTAKTILDFIRRVLETDIAKVSSEDLQTVASLNKVSETLGYVSNSIDLDGTKPPPDEKKVYDASHISNLARHELVRRSALKHY